MHVWVCFMLCAFSLLFCVSTIYLKICMKGVAMSRSVNSSSLTFWFFFFHQPSLRLKRQILTLNCVSEVLLRRGWNGSRLALRLSGPQLTSGTMDEWVCRSPRYICLELIPIVTRERIVYQERLSSDHVVQSWHESWETMCVMKFMVL